MRTPEEQEQDYKDRQKELAADRDEHNRRVGGGQYPKKYEKTIDDHVNPVD